MVLFQLVIVSILSVSVACLLIPCWEHLLQGSWGTQHWPFVCWQWFSGVWCLRFPMKEESWFCDAHRSYFVMHSDCWLSSLLHGLDSVHCCFYSEPHLPAVWMVIVVSFHSHNLCSIMWSVADHRCTCCILSCRICESEMTAAILGFRRVDLQGSSVLSLLNPYCLIAPLCFLNHGLLHIHVQLCSFLLWLSVKAGCL